MNQNTCKENSFPGNGEKAKYTHIINNMKGFIKSITNSSFVEQSTVKSGLQSWDYGKTS